MDGQGKHSVWLSPAELSAVAPSFRGLLRLHFFDSPSGVRQFLEYLISSDETSRKLIPQPVGHESFNEMLDELSSPALLADEAGLVLQANDAFLDWLGLSQEHALGKHLWELEQRHLSGENQVSRLWEMALAGEDSAAQFCGPPHAGDGMEPCVSLVPLPAEPETPRQLLVIYHSLEARGSIIPENVFHYYVDHLTGLPNRFLLSDRLAMAIQQAKRHGNFLAVMFIDLDRFKDINDSLGHQVGDLFLKKVAKRLTKSLRGQDTVARFGGDEFLVVAGELSNPDHANQVAEKILAMLGRPFTLEGREFAITASIGIALYPGHGEGPAELIQCADLAMYHAKDEGRNTWRVYTPEMGVKARKRLTLENQLRRAVAGDQFMVHYLPVFDYISGRIRATEALLRWKHPERGLLEPRDFMSTAEDSGLMVAIGKKVLEEACRQTCLWHEAGYHPLDLSVNLSAKQLGHRDLLPMVREVLEQAGLPADNLSLEMTESSLVANSERVIPILGELAQLGVQIILDDFGTGFSSLANLTRLPIGMLKIAQSFVEDLPDSQQSQAVVRSIIAMARIMHLKVVAEGVEFREQLDFLIRHGCENLQGFLFSQPLPAAEMTKMLEGNFR
jgi:diguanylate cyclase (GGDEF)-like protein